MNFSLFACIDSLDMEKQCLSYTTFSHGTKIKPMTGIEEHLYQGMRMRHSIIAGECCTPAHADTGLCSWTLDTGWWRLHADTVATTDTRPRHCHVTRPSLGRLLGCPHQGQEIPSPATKIPGVTHSRALTPASLLQGGRRQNLYLYYICYTCRYSGRF